MDIGVGLPNAVPDLDRDSLVEFARRADRRGFSTLGTIDRIVYPNYEPLLALAAAATVTDRIKLGTERAAKYGSGEYGDQIAASVASSEDMVQNYLQAFESVGCDELILFPASKDPAQVDLLADAAGLGH